MSIASSNGHFGRFGGQFVPETVIPALRELEQVYENAKADPAFTEELSYYLHYYSGRPTPLYRADRLTKALGGATIYLKREDLNHTGAHKINNTLGQVLLARRMGKGRIIAETGAGQHGVATATVCALFGLKCVVYMGEEDIKRQSLNVFRMRLLGAKVQPVYSGARTLKDAVNEALRDWVTNVATTHYIIGSAVGPHPYPGMVRDFQAVIGVEARQQILEQAGRLPDCIVACVGGGSNAIGIFHPFANDDVRLIGVEAAGLGLQTGKHAATLTSGSPGVLHGSFSFLLQDGSGQVQEAHSISAGLDYPGVGPEHSHYHESGRAEYVTATDAEAIQAFGLLSRTQGIIPALESAHAIAHAVKLAPELGRGSLLIVNLSGRGDKDVEEVERYLRDRGTETAAVLAQPQTSQQGGGQACGQAEGAAAGVRRGSRYQGSCLATHGQHRGQPRTPQPSRLGDVLAGLRVQGRKALIPYLTAGDPDLAFTYQLVQALEEAGADIVELGIPFSDPMADGPTIQDAARRALQAGTTVDGVMNLVRELRRVSEIPIALLAYYNTICRRGPVSFVQACARSGADAIIVADLPFEEAGDLAATACRYGVDIIRMLAPTSTEERIAQVGKEARGFIYCVSLTGVTGARHHLSHELDAFLGKVRRLVSVPIAVGFGVSTPAQAVEASRSADGVIVGSALIDSVMQVYSEKGREEAILQGGRFLASFRTALDMIHAKPTTLC